MSTHLEMAKHALFDKDGLRAADIKLYPGSNRDATSEQMAEQVNYAMTQLTLGKYDLVDPRQED